MLVTPLVLVMLALIVQGAVAMHAQHVAHAVAIQALDATRIQGGSTRAGRAEAEGTLAQLGPRILTDPQVTVTRDQTQASVTLAGHALSVIPGVHLPIRVTVTGPVEHVTATR